MRLLSKVLVPWGCCTRFLKCIILESTAFQKLKTEQNKDIKYNLFSVNSVKLTLFVQKLPKLNPTVNSVISTVFVAFTGNLWFSACPRQNLTANRFGFGPDFHRHETSLHGAQQADVDISISIAFLSLIC